MTKAPTTRGFLLLRGLQLHEGLPLIAQQVRGLYQNGMSSSGASGSGRFMLCPFTEA